MNRLTKKHMDKTNTQKPAPDREAVRMLAIELGAREAARRVGVNESTVLSWAKRYDWKLPKRKGGAISAIKLQSKPGDALIAAHGDLEGATKTALMMTLAKASQQVAGKEALDISSTAQLRDVCLAAARIFGWDGKPQTEVNITNQVGLVCDEPTRARLIALRAKLQAASAATIALPDQEPQPQANVVTAEGTSATVIDVAPSNLPGATVWGASAGASAPSDASPAFRAWLEHEAQDKQDG